MNAACSSLTLKDVCEAIVDCEHKTAPTQEVGHPSIRTPNIGRGRLILGGVNRVSDETYKLWTQRMEPQPGDLILAREAPVGNVAIIPKGLKVCLGQRTVLIRPDRKKVLPEYLVYMMLGDEIQGRVQSLSNGATVHHLNMKDIRGLELPKLPSANEQRRIASILSAYDDLIENNTRRIAILEEMARRIYEEWFVRFRFPGHENVRMVESELGPLPEGWQVKTLGDVCARMNSGNTPSRTNESFWANGTVDWYKTKELWDGYLFDSEERVTEAAIDARKTRVFEAGTILMAIYGSPTVGRLGITTRRSACNQAALGLTPDKEQITFWMLYFTLLALRAEFNNKAQGAAQQNISKEKVKTTAFLLAVMPVQKRFEEIVAPIKGLARALQEKNANLCATRDLLLPKLISGELDVSAMPEPEAAVA